MFLSLTFLITFIRFFINSLFTLIYIKINNQDFMILMLKKYFLMQYVKFGCDFKLLINAIKSTDLILYFNIWI